MSTISKNQIQTLINVLNEAKARVRSDLKERGYVTSESAVAYQIAIISLCGDRVVESIEEMLKEVA